MSRVLVTGVTGFLGGRIFAALDARADTTVIGLTRRPVPWLKDRLLVVPNPRTDDRALREAFANVDSVIHLAGANEVTTKMDPARARAETLLTAEAVLGAAQKAGTRRLAYVSTVHVYGDALTPGSLIAESCPPSPSSAYGATRLAVEDLLMGAADGVEVAVLRLTNSVGAPIDPAVDRWSLVSNDLARQAVSTGKLRLETSGTQCRDFIPLRDVTKIIISGILEESLPAGRYNLGSGQPTSVLDLARLVQEVAIEIGNGPPLTLSAPDPVEPPPEPYRIDVSKLSATGLRSTTSLRQGVEETLRFCIAHKDFLSRRP